MSGGFDFGTDRRGPFMGEVRARLSDAATRLAQERGCFTGHDVAHAAGVGFDKARRVLQDIVRADELVVIGHTRVPGVCRPLNVYAPPKEQQGDGSAAALAAVVRGWADFR